MKTFCPRPEKIVCTTGLWRSDFPHGGINRSPMIDESQMKGETVVFFRISRLNVLVQELLERPSRMRRKLLEG